MNTLDQLKTIIQDAIAPISVNGVLPQNAVLHVWDPTSCDWNLYATGGTAEWFFWIFDEDGLIQAYTKARIIGHCGTILVDLSW